MNKILNILLVEDNEADIIALKRSLKKEEIQFNLIEMSSAEKAIEFLKNSNDSLDLIVSDNGLPGMSGYDLCIELVLAGNKTPKILLTGYESTEIAIKALKIGVSDYIIKDNQGDYLKVLPLVFKDVVNAHQNKTEMEHAKTQLLSSQKRFQNLIENTSDLIQIMDLSGNIIFVNKTWKETLGYSEDDLLMVDIYDIIQQEKIEAYKETINTIFQGTTIDALTIETVLVKKNGDNIIVEGSINREHTDNSVPTVLSIFRDITQRKINEAALIEAKEKSEAAARFKSEFLANMSHDLRTPLNGIIGFTDILLQEKISPENRKYLEMIKSSGDMLLMLVNDILDFSKIEAGEMNILRNAEKLENILKDSVNTARMYMTQRVKNLEIKENYNTDINAHYLIDAFRIKQILNNLLSNAIKFTNNGYIEIGVSYLENNKLVFYVEDTGMGISLEGRKRIFSPYKQANELISINFGGTGLGLVISSKLTKLMDGEMGVISSNDESRHGTLFYFSIPAQQIDKNKVSNESTQIETNSNAKSFNVKSKNNKILVGEDNPVNQMLIKIMLEKIGFSVDIADNGVIACEKYFSSPEYRMIFMDMQMPVMDGIEATSKIREKEKNEHPQRSVPIIALTASVLKADRDKCFAAGCNNFLTKPINRAQLIEIVESYCQINNEN